jgi:aspartate/methionine/tyrosine aminotransferase
MDRAEQATETEDWLGAISPRARGVRESGIVEIFSAGRHLEDLIPLWVGEGSQPTPGFIQEAAVASLRAGKTFYTYQRGIPPLRQAMADYLTGLYANPVSPDNVFITGSGMQAIMLSCQLLLGVGDEMVVVSPVWPNIVEAVQAVGAKSVCVPMDFDGTRWQLDPERLFAAVTPRTRALFINSPGNPTGVVIDRATQAAILEFARDRGIWIVADEVYARLIYDGSKAAPSFLDLATPDDKVIQVNSFSKNWAMTGWRIGWMVAPVALGQAIENLIQYNTSGVAHFMQDAAYTAVTEGEPFVDNVLETCRRGRDLCIERLGRLNRVIYGIPDGSFYFFFALDGENDSRDLAFQILDQTSVGLAPGAAFGPGGERFLRLCFATEFDKLDEALGRLEKALM